MAAVAMPDGTVVDMPDQLDPAMGQRLRAFQSKAAPSPERVGWANENILGPSEILGSAAANFPGAAVNAVNNFVHRLGGDSNAKPLVPSVPTGSGGRQLMSDIASIVHPANGGQEQPLDATYKRPDLGSSPNPLGSSGSATLGDVIGQTGSVLNDTASVLPAAGAAEGIAWGIKAARTAAAAPIAAGDIEGALSAVGYKNLPRQGGGSMPAQLGARIAGEPTVAATQTLNNQAVTTQLAKHEAGVPAANDLDYASIAKARLNGPGQVYNAAHDALPATLNQDETLQHAIASVGDTTSQLPRSPDVDALKQTMLSQPEMTRDQLFANIQQARDRASRFFASDQPDAHAIGDAYQNVANSYEDFVGRQLAANPVSPVSLNDWQAARTAFAKNYAVQTALKGTEVDASKLAALQRKDPERLTGGLQLIAEQHNRYPLSTGFGPTTFEQGGVGASGSLEGNVARHVTGPMVGAGIGAALGGAPGAAIGSGAGLLGSAAFQGLIRRALGGSPARGAALADAATSDPRLSSFFGGEPAPQHEPLPPFPGPQAPLSLADDLGAGGKPQGPGEGISLADVLSHGVEREPPAGLSAGPMGAPADSGVPFKPHTSFMSGPLSLADDLAGPATQQRQASAAADEGEPPRHPTLKDLMEELSQHPDVLSQGIPEGIMQRTSPIVDRGGSDESSVKAASPEAMNRGTRNVLRIDPDANASPVLKDVSQIDAKAPRGHLLIDGDSGEIIDRGGLPRSLAEGLRNRWEARNKPLDAEFQF
jgi:hypothetical protein